MNKKITYIVTAVIAVAGLGMVRPAYGLEAPETESSERQETRQTTDDSRTRTDKRQPSRQARDDNQAEAKQKDNKNRAAAKLRACTNRETEIKKSLAHVAERATNHIAVFSKITERTQTFYEKKGKVLDSYDALVADVAAKKTAAEAAVANVKAVSEVFTCGDNPQAALQSVRDVLKAKRSAMQTYKQSVRQLIVDVKSLQPETTAEVKQ